MSPIDPKQAFLLQVIQIVTLTGIEPEAAWMHPADLCEIIATLGPDAFIPFTKSEGALRLFGLDIYPCLVMKEGANPVFLLREPLGSKV